MLSGIVLMMGFHFHIAKVNIAYGIRIDEFVSIAQKRGLISLDHVIKFNVLWLELMSPAIVCWWQRARR